MYQTQCERTNTTGLSREQLYAFYKAESVHEDCRFYLETQRSMPESIRVRFYALFQATVTKTKPAHKKELADLKRAWQTWALDRELESKRNPWIAVLKSVGWSLPTRRTA